MYLDDLVRNAARCTPDKPALVTTEGRDLSYEKVWQLTQSLNQQLLNLGVRQGMKVGLYLPKHLLAAIGPFSLSMLGAVFVPINPTLKASQVAHIAEDCGMHGLITSPERLVRLQSELGDFKVPYILLSNSPSEPLTGESKCAVWSEIDEHGLHELVNREAPAKELAALLYTSGSTGKAKGVMVSHENLILGAESVNQYLGINAEDRILALLPFSFDYGLNQLISSVMARATCFLCDFFLVKDVVKLVARHKITGLAGVPTLWAQLCAADWGKEAGDSVRYFTNSGGSLPQQVLEQLQKIFPNASPYLMYGLTEAFRSTYVPPDRLDDAKSAIGISVPNAEIFVVDAEGNRVDGRGQGELVHAGPLVTLGYWDRPEDTAAVFKTLPWDASQRAVWSGDEVFRDEQGILYFLGRRDAMIKTSGYRVSPEEIEEVCYGSRIVAQAGAFGLNDARLGQTIHVAVVFKEELELSEQELLMELKNHCRINLPTYLVPLRFIRYEELPLNANRKIDRKQLAADNVACAHTSACGASGK